MRENQENFEPITNLDFNIQNEKCEYQFKLKA